MEKCSACFYFDVPAGVPEGAGRCTRYPPTVVMMRISVDASGRPVISPLQKPHAMTENPQAVNPIVPSGHRCGEHRPLVSN